MLAGIDEFLDQVTVLPPGEWDPSIRIEPPKSVPSQESRKTKDSQPPVPNGKTNTDDDDEGCHGDDPALQRTNRCSIMLLFLTLPQTKSLHFCQLEEFPDNSFELDENGRKFSKSVKNTLGKGEIARYEQFLLFPHCFQKIDTADTLKQGPYWERVNSFSFGKSLG